MKQLIIALNFLFLCTLLWAQTEPKTRPDSSQTQNLGEVADTVQAVDFFVDDEPLKISLKYDITSFIKNKTKGEYLDAELIVFYDDMQPVVKKVRIQARGNYRRGECFFPPFFLNFKTDPVKDPKYMKVNKVKVVTHCSSTDRGEETLLREYLVYKLYNILTDKSFRVRLLDIKYIDTGKKGKTYESYGFVIEPADVAAKRNNCVIIESMAITGKDLVEEDADRAALFQYMISNTDWRIKSGHNTKFLKSLSEVTNKLMVLPYDFDFSGFVGASYSFPQEWSDTQSIYDRDYLGYCRDNPASQLKNIELFNSKKQEILKTISNFTLISEKDREEVTEFINEFFDEISNPKDFVNSIKRECKPIDF